MALVALAVAGGVAVYARVRPRPVPLAVRFRTAAVSRGDVVREVRASGHLEAESTVPIGAEISGRIESVATQFNAHVKRGDLLAQFDQSTLLEQAGQVRAALQAARASLQAARTEREQAAANLVRVARLHASQVASDQEYDNAKFSVRNADGRVRVADAQVAAQVAALRVAETNLLRTVIRAPIDGVVITRNVDPGQTVASALQTPVLFSVAADLTRMRVIAAVDEADIGQVAEGQRVEFNVSAYPARAFVGTVSEVRNAATIVQDVVTYGAVIEVANADLALRPGMTATVRVRTGEAHDVLRMPNGALHFVPPGQAAGATPAVWTLNRDQLQSVAVQPGLSDDTWTAVDSPALTAGQIVLVDLTPEGRKAYGISK